MPATPAHRRWTAALAGALALVLFAACGGRVKVGPSAPPPPAPQAGPPARPKPPQPVVRLKAYELFDLGKEGEDKYKGKVVEVSGMVDVNATKRPGPGGTSTLVVQGKPGEPPYAIATFGHDSEGLLFAGTFQPACVYLQGTYGGRDERGTVLLSDATVTGMTKHVAGFDFRRDDPHKPRPAPPEKKKAPVRVSAEQLAQELYDDLMANYRRYYGPPLRIEGVVADQMKSEGVITMLQFKPPVKDRKTNKPVEFVVFCGLRDRVPVDSPAAGDLAVGKRVRLVGSLFAAGNGQATLGQCVVQKPGPGK